MTFSEYLVAAYLAGVALVYIYWTVKRFFSPSKKSNIKIIKR